MLSQETRTPDSDSFRNLSRNQKNRHIGVDPRYRFPHNRGSLVERIDLRHKTLLDSDTLQRIASVEIYLSAVG
ncbi:MAG: hypothetical protein CMM01_03840 [Rhodopirellula sp.]|nr:hypothetical protein [Rhodopirellula sp.]